MNRPTRKGKNFWGPPIWATIHILSIYFRPETTELYKEFFWLLTKLLPCDYCKKNLAAKLTKYPPDNYLSSSKQAFLYSYIIHDLANQHITQHNPKTPKESPQFDAVLDSYSHGLRTQGSNFWGPPIWTTIHILAVTLRIENAEYYKRFLEVLSQLLPDRESRMMLGWVIQQYLPDSYLLNNHDAFFYSYIIHNAVNEKLGKISPPYTTVKSSYFLPLGQECNDCRL